MTLFPTLDWSALVASLTAISTHPLPDDDREAA